MFSQVASFLFPNKDSEAEMDPHNGSKLKGVYFPDEVLELILCHVEIQTLLNCRRVCKKWNSLIVSQVLKTRAAWAGLTRDMGADTKLGTPWHNWYIFLAPHSPFRCNLVRNPCGQEKLSNWVILSNGGDGWKVETSPEGLAADVPPSPPEPALRNYWERKTRSKRSASNACFVTSFGSCVKEQTVSLTPVRIMGEILDRHRPTIVYREWFVRRFDCGGQYTLTVSLLDKDCRELLRCIHHAPVEDNFNWQKAENKLENYPEGVRYVKFTHRANDNQFWKGHYGPKITRSTVMLVPPGVNYEIDSANNVPAMTVEEFERFMNRRMGEPAEWEGIAVHLIPDPYVGRDGAEENDDDQAGVGPGREMNMVAAPGHGIIGNSQRINSRRLRLDGGELEGRGNNAQGEERSSVENDDLGPGERINSRRLRLDRGELGNQERGSEQEERGSEQEERGNDQEGERSNGEMNYDVDSARILSRRRRLHLGDLDREEGGNDQEEGERKERAERGNDNQGERHERGNDREEGERSNVEMNDSLTSPPFIAGRENEERGGEGEDRPR